MTEATTTTQRTPAQVTTQVTTPVTQQAPTQYRSGPLTDHDADLCTLLDLHHPVHFAE